MMTRFKSNFLNLKRYYGIWANECHFPQIVLHFPYSFYLPINRVHLCWSGEWRMILVIFLSSLCFQNILVDSFKFPDVIYFVLQPSFWDRTGTVVCSGKCIIITWVFVTCSISYKLQIDVEIDGKRYKFDWWWFSSTILTVDSKSWSTWNMPICGLLKRL